MRPETHLMMRPSLRLNLRAVHYATVHVDFDSYVWIVYNDNWELRRRTQQNKVRPDPVYPGSCGPSRAVILPPLEQSRSISSDQFHIRSLRKGGKKSGEVGRDEHKNGRGKQR